MIFQTLTRGDLRDISLIGVAAAIVGLSFGAIATGGGLPFWVPVVMSLVVFAGASQFAAVGIILSGGNPVAAVVAGLILNARHLPFGFAISDILGPSLAARLVGAHILTDEALAFSMRDSDPVRRRALYWGCAVCLFFSWNIGVLAGGIMGATLGDAETLGLDAAFPAVLLALVLPALKDKRTRIAAVVGAAIAFVLTPYLPAGVPVLVSLAGLVVLIGQKNNIEEVPSRELAE